MWGPLLQTFFETAVSSAICHFVVCWGSSITAAYRKRLDKLIKKASLSWDALLNQWRVVIDDDSPFLQYTPAELQSTFSEREVSQVNSSCIGYTRQPALLAVK